MKSQSPKWLKGFAIKDFTPCVVGLSSLSKYIHYLCALFSKHARSSLIPIRDANLRGVIIGPCTLASAMLSPFREAIRNVLQSASALFWRYHYAVSVANCHVIVA